MEKSLLIVSRRQHLQRAAQVVCAVACAGLSTGPNVWAMSKADKRDFLYQDKPKDGKSCSNCKMFTSSASSKGVCAIVDGEVIANGWCMAYTPRT